MKMNKNKRNKKVVAASIAVALLVVGTFAWQSFSQIATNEIITKVDQPGARLHDYYNGFNKDIFVENYGTGTDVYARIRLDEYLEYGIDAGVGIADNLTIIRGDILNDDEPEFADVKTWDTFDLATQNDFTVSADTNEDETIRDFRKLVLGGETMYMPTFNQHPYSLDADVNGTYLGFDGSREDGTPYDDYVDYSIESTLTGNVITPDPADPTNPKSADNNVAFGVTHTAKSTATATAVTMEKWLEDGCPVGDIWVFDTDGWAYYAKPIPAGTASGLLLNAVDKVSNPTEEWYYAINVVAQFATKGDWGTNGSETEVGTGMYAGGMTEAGEYVLNKAAGIATVTNMTVVQSNGDSLTSEQTTLTTGQSATYVVVSDLMNGVTYVNDSGLEVYTDTSASLVTWSYVNASGSASGATLSSAGTFSASTAGTYTVTATSVQNSAKSVSIKVTVS